MFSSDWLLCLVLYEYSNKLIRGSVFAGYPLYFISPRVRFLVIWDKFYSDLST